MRKTWAYAAVGAVAVLISPAAASDRIKIGVITTLTTSAAVVGEEQLNGFNLALEHLGGKLGGIKAELIVEDDGFKPDTGRKKADKLLKSDHVDIVTGLIWSHVLLAVRKPVLNAGKILISANAGHSRMAGAGCHPHFFNASWQNDMIPMALGEVLNQRGVKSLYVMAPNYAAGKDMVAGVERSFKGEIRGRDFTKWGRAAQLDFQAELAKAKASGSEALFAFYPGKAGSAFLRQFGQSGAAQTLRLYTAFTVDALTLPAFQAANMTSVLGSLDTMHWNVDFDNAQNRRFVADFMAAHDRYPSFYAAQSYDVMFMIDAAVRAVDGHVGDKAALAAALRRNDYPSVRGPYALGRNNFPVQNYYLRRVVADDQGRWTHETVKTVLQNAADPHVENCPL